jgi:hypothetical protein
VQHKKGQRSDGVGLGFGFGLGMGNGTGHTLRAAGTTARRSWVHARAGRGGSAERGAEPRALSIYRAVAAGVAPRTLKPRSSTTMNTPITPASASATKL